MGRQARTDFNPLAITRRSLAQTHTEIARAYAAQGQLQKAEQLFQLLMLVDPRNPLSAPFAFSCGKSRPCKSLWQRCISELLEWARRRSADWQSD
jgi:hypothetical protein